MGRTSWLARWWTLAFFAHLLAAAPFFLNTASGTWSAWHSLPLDDSWIHLDYIRGLATQGCLCYNDHIWEAGATSWGWVLLAVPFYLIGHLALGLDEVVLVRLLGLGLGALAALFVFLLLVRATGSRIVGMIGAAVVTFEPESVFLRISGMEGALLTAAVLGSTLALLSKRWALAGLGLALAFWSRPEAAYFVAVALVVTAAIRLIPHAPMLLRTWCTPTLRAKSPNPPLPGYRLQATDYRYLPEA